MTSAYPSIYRCYIYMLTLIASEGLCEDVLTHPYQHASVCSFCSSVQIFAVLLFSVYGSLQTTLQLTNAHRLLAHKRLALFGQSIDITDSNINASYWTHTKAISHGGTFDI